MFTVYILQCETTGRHYCGQTSELSGRVRQHNDPEYRGSLTTKRFPGPWRVVFELSSSTRSEVLKLEGKIKKRGIERYLAKLAAI